MKFIDEYRDRGKIEALASQIASKTRGEWSLMEVCGGQTHNIVRFGIDQILPATVRLIHGPGCPVCVTPVELIDAAIELALKPGLILTTFGDMLRVPGTAGDLLHAQARGGDVRAVYSPLDAVKIARENPSKEVVFFAVGFETTAPAAAGAIATAEREKLGNFSILSAHFLVPPALEAILADEACQVNGFIAPGHVCAVTGYVAYEELAARRRTPVVVTGFEPLDILQGVALLLDLLASGRSEVVNQYSRVVRREGNPSAQSLVNRFFEVCDRNWRGIGVIPESGMRVRESFIQFDAAAKLSIAIRSDETPTECISGNVLRGVRKPADCPAFGIRCNPEQPLGAPMVSTEGACSAYYRYRREETLASRDIK